MTGTRVMFAIYLIVITAGLAYAIGTGLVGH
jgi:hypothetical protein